jgi:hypothetical protein
MEQVMSLLHLHSCRIVAIGSWGQLSWVHVSVLGVFHGDTAPVSFYGKKLVPKLLKAMIRLMVK